MNQVNLQSAVERTETTSTSALPRVGVVIPCFNQGQYAKECVDSLHAQTYPNWHAVLVNDASTDGVTADLCNALAHERVKVVHMERNHGRASVRNQGVAQLGQVDFILMQDCDDKLSPTYIQQLIDAINGNDKVGVVYSTLHFFGNGSAENQMTWPVKPWDRSQMYLDNVIPGPGTVFRAKALNQTDGWRADFNQYSGEDYDIWLQVVEAGWEPLWVRSAVLHYRQHGDSFLAHHQEGLGALIAPSILKHHRNGIRATCGTRAFIRKWLLTSALHHVRRFKIEGIKRVVLPLLRFAPLATISLFCEYYLSRLRSLVTRQSP